MTERVEVFKRVMDRFLADLLDGKVSDEEVDAVLRALHHLQRLLKEHGVVH